MFIVLADQSIDFVNLAIGLFGGLGLFLFGMHQMADGLRAAAGAGMKHLLGRLTTNRFTGALTGAIVTAIIQSSSVTTVLVVGFVSAQLMTLHQAIGVIMGANIGTTVTAQIVAFNVTQLAWLMVAIGFALRSFAKRRTAQHYGLLLLGLGLLFLGMEQMSFAAEPLRDYDPFVEMMHHMDHPLWAILLGAFFTAVVQSSSATTGLVIVLASQGFLTLDAGIALAIGANVGTCFTAVLAAIGKPTEAVRAAVVHVIFNLLGALLWLAFIPQLGEAARAISPSFATLSGVERLAAETPRQIANANTIFNVANVLILIWFTSPIARLTVRLVPGRPPSEPERVEPKYLQEVYLDTPTLALDRTEMELQHMGSLLIRMVREAPGVVIAGSYEQLQQMACNDTDIDRLHAAILKYLRSVAVDQLTPGATERLADLIAVANELENIGDIVARDLVTQGYHRLDANLQFSSETQTAMRPLGQAVALALQDSLRALEHNDVEMAHKVLRQKPNIQQSVQDARDHLGRRLLADEPHRVELFRLESEVVNLTQRLYYHAKQIAKIVAGKS
jgi:phosphate:Na+ symporter